MTSTTPIILHHFEASPFSEKVRLVFGLKNLDWTSVLISRIMPRPDLMPLTGGYRRTPVMQIGADIYCDTQLMMLEIERHSPEKPLLPVGQEGEARAVTMWIDRNIFWAAVGVVMGAIGDKLPDGDPQKKVVVDYKATYESTAKQPVSTFGGHAYDGLYILVDAMNRANGTDSKKIRDEIEKTKGFIGTGGIVTMSTTDHLGLDLSAFRMLEIKGGDWNLIQPGS